MSRLGTFSARLHSGEVGYDFIGRRRRWFLVSLVLIVVSILSLSVRGLHFGVEFSGGSVFQFSAPRATESQLQDAVAGAIPHGSSDDVVVQSVSGGKWRIQTPSLSSRQVTGVQEAISKQTGIPADKVSQEQIGPSWGLQVSQKAGIGLLIFLAACVLFLWVVFDWKMAASSMIALVHDLVITAGVYSLVGFEVTPATVIGFLTILGYSLYDTVVVFDKVRENTAGILGGNRTTYSRAANLAVNQTLARSINTSVVALLPVAAILIVASSVLGAGTLQDLALALLVGMATGTYSSIFIATPILAMLKEREPRAAALRKRVEAREAAQGKSEKAAKRSGKAKAGAAAKSGDTADEDADAGDTAEGEPAEETAGSGAAKPAKVSVQAGRSGSGDRSSSTSSRNVSRRGGQRPQPQRSSKRGKSKGRKKR
ncbi:MAG: protein translocase subunit SecF [Acidothermales bacterium]|nr:protein translocase subunit SecF [Acidothermales bacterium]